MSGCSEARDAFVSKSNHPAAPIGVFDSGVGGLTVLEALRRELPGERFVYLGDTARVPYGTKSPETVAHYARNVARLLLERGCKALVIACNTASAFGLDAVRALSDVPVLDVIAPVAGAVAQAGGRRVGVLGTRGTVASGAYLRALAAYPSVEHVTQQACPLLVPLAEEGWTDGEVPSLVLDRYLADLLRRERLDSMILGCTHYPLLRGEIEAAIQRFSPTEVRVHESGSATAVRVAAALSAADLAAPSARGGGAEFLVTDDPAGFLAVSGRFLGEPVSAAEHVHVAS